MPYIEVPITGDGSRENPYRANTTLPKSAVIPTDSQGKPRHTTTIVWVPANRERDIPRNIRKLTDEEGRRLARQLDPGSKPRDMERRAIHVTRNR
jgi:hypothetical protein